MKDNHVFNQFFFGKEISTYGRKNGYVDYATLASTFNHVLCNDALRIGEFDDWQLCNGSELDDEDNYAEVFQYYIIDDNGARILCEYTDELVWYNEKYDVYVWGVTHWGTSWDYVLTDIRCNVKETVK